MDMEPTVYIVLRVQSDGSSDIERVFSTDDAAQGYIRYREDSGYVEHGDLWVDSRTVE